LTPKVPQLLDVLCAAMQFLGIEGNVFEAVLRLRPNLEAIATASDDAIRNNDVLADLAGLTIDIFALQTDRIVASIDDAVRHHHVLTSSDVYAIGIWSIDWILNGNTMDDNVSAVEWSHRPSSGALDSDTV